MMDINTKELQRFHELWTPVLSALPAVINAIDHANELKNYVAGLEAKTETVRREQQALVDAARAEVDKATAAIVATRAEHASAVSDLNDFTASVRERRDTVVREADAKIAAVNAQVSAVSNSVEQARLAQAARYAAEEKAFAERITLAEIELAAVEARIAKAEKAFAALRAKLE